MEVDQVKLGSVKSVDFYVYSYFIFFGILLCYEVEVGELLTQQQSKLNFNKIY
jgi:hypothetical protein